MSVEYTIVCDGCAGIVAASSANATTARKEVRRMGGRAALPDGKDLCPDCVRDGVDVWGLGRG